MELLLGHLIGDYLLQTDGMASQKKERGWRGNKACFIHCLLYTLAIHIFVGHWIAFPLIFLSHWIIDRYKWLYNLHTRVYKRPKIDGHASPHDVALSLIVYIAADNTLHLLLMYIILRRI